MRHAVIPSLLLAALLAGPGGAQPVDVYSRPRHVARSHDYDVIHYRIELRFDESTRSFTGETTITLEPLRDGFDSCLLDAETFAVTAVIGSEGRELGFEQPPGKLKVRLPRAYRYRERLSFRVLYHASGVAVDPTKFGMKTGYDLGLGFKARTARNPQLINTLSYPEGARHWFPCYDHPADKATSEVIATVRDGYQVVSNGRLAGVTEDRGKHEKTFHWRQEQPHSTYLFVLAAGPYVELKDPGSPPVSFWIYPADAADAPRSFSKTRDILDFFGRELEYPYPWAKYDQIVIPRFGGGSESTSATVVGDSIIHDEMADKDFPAHWLVAHEAAHQWFGDLVTMRDWSDAWMNEGFATFYENLYFRHNNGEEEGALDLLNKKNAYFGEATAQYQRPVVFDRWEVPDQNFDRHSYQKAAAVLSMLRWLLGESDFRRAIAYFLHKHAYQSVDTRDLQVAIQESTGQAMAWFFDQWIFQPGHPVLDVHSRWASNKLALTVSQKQAGRAPVFQMPVDIGITTASGKKVERVWMRQREETFSFDCREKPLLVRFDEGDHLLCELRFPKPPEDLFYQLAHDDAMGRLWAASQLRPHASRPAVLEALRRSATHDAFWAVRREALRATEARAATADVALWKQCSTDPKSAVRAEAIRLLGTLGLPSLAGFFAERFRREDSYVVQVETIRALGGCRDRSAIPVLEAAALRSSPRDMLRQAAREALEKLRQ